MVNCAKALDVVPWLLIPKPKFRKGLPLNDDFIGYCLTIYHYFSKMG